MSVNDNKTHDIVLKIKLEKIKAAKKKAGLRLKVFGRKSSLHGLKYVVNEKGNIFTKSFWLLVLATSGFCVYVLLSPLLVNKSVVDFVPNTLYLEWNTVFPAVTVCETYLGYKNTLKKLTELYPDLLEPLDHTKRKLYSDILFGGGSCSKSACGPCGEDIPCDFPWRDVAEKVRLPCEEMIEDCHYNGWKFPCCKYFYSVDSENGPCIAFNSLLHENAEKQLFTVNRTTGPGELFFKTRTSLSVFVHGPEELATKYLLPNSHFDVRGISMGSTEYIFSMVEMESDQSFVREGIDVRECRYPHELIEGQDLHQYLQYSYGACKLALETDEIFEICDCVHPIRDLAYKNIYCNLTGIICLINYKDPNTNGNVITSFQAEKIKLGVDKHKEHHHDEEDLCIPSCVEIEMSTIHIRNNRISEPGPYNVSVKMANLPTLRFRRTVFRTDLDLVVTLGGLAGLFFGASILSLAETLYLLFRRNKL